MRLALALLVPALAACGSSTPVAEEPAVGEADDPEPREGAPGELEGLCGTGEIPPSIEESISHNVMLAFERDSHLEKYTWPQLAATRMWTLLLDPGADLGAIEKWLGIETMESTKLIESTYNVTFPEGYDVARAIELMESRDEILLCYPQVAKKMQKKGVD